MSCLTLVMTLLGTRLSFPLPGSFAAVSPSVPPTLCPNLLLIVKSDHVVSWPAAFSNPAHPDTNAAGKPS